MIPETHLFLDIESLPTDRRDFIEEVEAAVRCPASYKKQEAIAEWWETEGPIARKAAVHKTGLDGGIARMAAIAWGWGAGDVKAAHTAVDGAHSIDRERLILTGFFAECQAVYDATGAAPTIVGHCVTTFDIRWIWHRAIVLGVTPPWWWPVAAKPWDADSVQDTAVMWIGTRDRISLDRLARILDVGGKGEMDGSQVWDAWERGEHEKVREYCADDVRLVRRIWCRIVGENAPADEIDEETEVAEVEVPAAVALDPDPVAVPVEIVVSELVPEPVVEKPIVQRPRVVPVFLREDFPEEELA